MSYDTADWLTGIASSL